jgi:hypothetical protein
MLHGIPSIVVCLSICVLMLTASGIGFYLGRKHHPSSDIRRAHFGAVQASLLGLLALLLGFSLNMADQRYEGRRVSMLDDTTTLAAIDFRTEFLPEPSRTDFKRLLSAYLGIQISAMSDRNVMSTEQFEALGKSAEQVYHQMLLRVREEMAKEPLPLGVLELADKLNEALSVHRRWIAAMETSVPVTILVLLLFTSVIAAGVVGFSGGLGAHRGRLQHILFACVVSGIIYVIHDLDTPHAGFSRVGKQPLIQLKSTIDREFIWEP